MHRIKQRFKVAKTLLIVLASLAIIAPSVSQEEVADVVVMIDTSLSMAEEGMDPERTSTLVAKLLSDIVPSSLSIIRLFDLDRPEDIALVDTEETGQLIPCREDPTSQCQGVTIKSDLFDVAYQEKIGVLSRPSLGDSGFKKRLETELIASSNQSYFSVSLASASRVFNDLDHANKNRRKMLIWLSDGRTDNTNLFVQQIGALRNQGVEVRSVIFGNGSNAVSRDAQIPYSVTRTPEELMTVFADLLRKIIGAPIELSGQLGGTTTFDIPREIEQAWVIVYGDNTLDSVNLTNPDGKQLSATHASDRQGAAGAYRVAYLKAPTAGTWSVSKSGGGTDAAYAVILDSSLYPYLISQNDFPVDTRHRIEVNIKSSLTDNVVNDSQIVGNASITAFIDGKKFTLNDQGLDGDKRADDFIYSGHVSTSKEGENRLLLSLSSNNTNTQREYRVTAIGQLQYYGTGLKVDLGSLLAGSSHCIKTRISDVDIKGQLAVQLTPESGLPSGHKFSISQDKVSNKQVILSHDDQDLNVCLEVSKFAASASTRAKLIGTLSAVGGISNNDPSRAIPVFASWDVTGLSFWELWKHWIYLLLTLLAIAFTIAGFVLPKRFRASLHLVTADSLQELNENIPTQINVWKGTGSGFYRNARAYIYNDHRVSGKDRNAAASLNIEKNTLIINGINGYVLHQQGVNGEWEPVIGKIYRMGSALRISQDGLIFKLLDL